MSLAAQLHDDGIIGSNNADTDTRAKGASATGNGLFLLANGTSTLDLLSWLGIATEERDEKTFATCPGCGEDGALLCKDGGIKCLHNRCADAGPRKNPGFRTNVDIVLAERGWPESRAADAAKEICAHYGIKVPERRRTERDLDGEDESDPTDVFGPEEPPEGRFDDEEPPATSVEPSPLVSLGSLLAPAIERAEQRRSGAEKPVPVPFRDYSEALCGGFWPGVHTQVAGTGAGKSTKMFQCATFAAREQVPVLYVGLELSQFQVALRALGEAAGVSWSKLYTGRGSPRDIERAREALPELTELPFYVEFGTAHGWAPSNLVTRAEQIRKQHPTGPMLVVLDFLQLVGSEPVAFGSAPDLRERIGRASYAGVHVANTLGASVVLISSSARAHYGLLAGDVKSAGLATCSVPGHVGPVRTILGPDALLGLGKESGEIEYSAESQTVLVKWPAPLDNGERVVIAAIPKLRYGPPRWVPFRFWQRFEELPFQTLEDLPEVQGKGGKGAGVTDDELDARVLATVARLPGLSSKNDIAKNTTGTKQPVLKAIDRLLGAGKLAKLETGFSVVGGPNR